MQDVNPFLLGLFVFAAAVLIYVLLEDIIDVVRRKQTHSPSNNMASKEPINETPPPIINKPVIDTNDPKWVREHLQRRALVQKEYNRKFRLDAEIISQVRRIRHVRKEEERQKLETNAKEEQSRFVEGLILWEERQRQEVEQMAAQERAKKEEERKAKEEYYKRKREEEESRRARFLKEQEEREKREIAERIKERYRKQQLEKIVRQELIDSGELFGEQPKRPPIPREIVDAVYKRDGGRCVYCGATQNLQLDHIIPFSKGGATTLENLQLLCQKCNIEKSNKIG